MKLKNFSYSILAFLLVFSACKEEEQVDNTLRVAFQEFNGTITEVGGSDAVNVVSSRAAESAITVLIGIANDCGGNFDDYSFTNSAGESITPNEEGQISVSIPSGQSSANFMVATADGSLPVGAQNLSFSIVSVENAALNDTHLFYDLRIGTGAGFFSTNYTKNFEDCSPFSSPSDFSLFFEEGSKQDRALSCRAEGKDGGNALVASAFGGEAGIVDAWLISVRRFNFGSATQANISMDMKSDFIGNGTLEILWSSDYCGNGNPNAATWSNITILEDQFPEKGSKAYKSITANVTDLLGEAVYLAFRFTEASNDNSTSYAIDNLRVTTGSSAGGGGGGGVGNSGSSFSTDFNECTQDFSTPSGFAEYFLSDKTDRGWGCRSFGLDGSRAVRASAFGGSPGTDNAWLIVEDQLDFTDLSSVNFKMSVFSQFDGSGELLVKYSTDYIGTGTPEDATWTDIDVINEQIPAPASATWVEINEDLTVLAGEVVYIAFQYVGAASDGAASFDIDNLAINDPTAFEGDGGNPGGGGGGENVSIADAKSQMDANVTITGIVTTPDYGANNGQYYVQDETAGINVIHFSNNGLVSFGDEVTITGTIGAFSNQTQIEVSSVTVNSSGNSLPNPVTISSTDLTLDSPLLGSRVVINNVSLVDASQWPVAPINTSSGVNVDAISNGVEFIIRIDRGESFYDGSPVPPSTFSLIGILGNFNDDVQILPFYEGDVD